MVKESKRKISRARAAESGTSRQSKKDKDIAVRILDATLAQADRVGWDNVYLADVAQNLRMPLVEIRRHYRDLDAVANAHFTRAFAAMLAESSRVRTRRPEDRIETLLGAWFEALRPHAKIGWAMIAGKLYPFHPHHWVPLIFSLSRLIQWLRDAAFLRVGLPRRSGEEIFLSALFVLALIAWRGDGQAGERRARALIARALGEVARFRCFR